jgi:putative redox protein
MLLLPTGRLLKAGENVPSIARPAHRKATTLKKSTVEDTSPKQAVVISDLASDGALTGHAGTAKFPIGGPDGRGGTTAGPNPYDLLSASLAACTAATIRLHARRKKLPLSHIEVAVSYHHGMNDGPNSFERVIQLEGSLNDLQHKELMQIADMCPVGKILGLDAEIHTRPDGAAMELSGTPASYEDDLNELSIPYIDPD